MQQFEYTKRKDGNIMSPKELLYIEDALGHDVEIKAVCKDAASNLQDNDLRNFVNEIAQGHAQCFNRIYGLLG